MSEPEPSISVNVNPTNPGQFFACCGLLELADRLWSGAEGWFADAKFHIACAGELADLMMRLTGARIDSSLSSPQRTRLATLLSKAKDKLTAADREDKSRLQEMWKVERLHLSPPFDVWLDWWRDDRGERTELKTWAAKQMVAKMAEEMLAVIKSAGWSQAPNPNELFQWVRCDSLPFNFDSDLSGAGSARDAGFSADTLGLKASFRPLLELLAFIGIQRFRPASADGDRIEYCLWSVPLAPPVAFAAAIGALDSVSGPRYEFDLFNRTKYMKVFLPAQLRRGAQ